MNATPLEMAFVQGAKWWQFFANGATAFPSEVDQMEAEAKRRLPTLGKTEEEVWQIMRERKEGEGEQHGIDCEKKLHTGDGYIHAEDDDGPFDDDGITYCGRCHRFMRGDRK